MTTFTDKELIKEIKERISSLDVRDNIERRAYEIALASLEAEPIAWECGENIILFNPDTVEAYAKRAEISPKPLYAASPVSVTPDGWVIVPKKLTAENGAKGVLSGEFSETTFISCPECFGDDDCDTCDGSGRIEIKVPVTWTTIKSIWDKGIAHFAAKPPQEVNRG